MLWQSIGDQSTFATLERHGIKYLQALGPLEIALTNAEAAAANGGSASTEPLNRAMDAVTAVDKELGGQLRTEDRWTGLRSKIESLPARGTHSAVTAAYSGADDLLLALVDKVRNNSNLIRDPDMETYYLEDGAAQELPEAVIGATHFANLLTDTTSLSSADRLKALVDLSSGRSDLASNAQDLYDDTRLAVDGADSRSLGAALLSKLDRFNRSVDSLVPLMQPLLAENGRVDATQAAKARDEAQAAAADLSAALLVQIDSALQDRVSSLGQRRLLAVAAFVVSVLLTLTPVGVTLANRRRRAAATGGQDQPEKAPQAPAHQPAAPPNSWPVQPMPAQWPDPRPHDASDPEYARWERFGVPQ